MSGGFRFYAPILGDGLDGLDGLEPASANLLLSDLPSGETAAKFDKPPDFARLWPAIWRALSPGGCVVLFASSIRFAATVIASQPKAYRYDLIWEKSLATGHLNASGRPLRAHEFILVFTESGASTFNPQYVETGIPISSVGEGVAVRSENYGGIRHTAMSRAGATDRHPRSVLHFGSLATRNENRWHPQQKPNDLLRMLVLQYSNRGDLVVDPFAGSGSTLEAAQSEGRRAIGWDSSPRFGKAAATAQETAAK